MIQRFFNGFGFFFEGRRLLAKIPHFWLWILVPLLIDFAIFFTGIYFGAEYIQAGVNFVTPYIVGAGAGSFAKFFQYVFLILLWVTFLVFYLYFVYVIASVVASPFYGVIAERALTSTGVLSKTSESLLDSFSALIRMLWTSLLRGAILIILGLFLFVASFVPGLNLIAGFCIFIIIALDIMDYSFEAMRFTLRQRIQLFLKNLPEFLGMGAFVGLTVCIPGLILLVMPVLVAGAASKLSKMVPLQKEIENDSRPNS